MIFYFKNPKRFFNKFQDMIGLKCIFGYLSLLIKDSINLREGQNGVMILDV